MSDAPAQIPTAWRALVHLWDSELVEQQSQNRELVIYSHHFHRLVVVFWPMVDGVRLGPKEVVRLIREGKLHWPCFCSALEDRALVCRIFILGDSVSAYCHYAPVARCRFFVPLHRIYETAQLTFEYPSPILHHPPYSNGVLPSPLITEALPLFGPHRHIGYLGDHLEDICQGSKVPLLCIPDSDFVDRPEFYYDVVGKKAYTDAVTQTDPEDENADREALTSSSQAAMSSQSSDVLNIRVVPGSMELAHCKII
ncbi:hypothetical protein R3P38DRAFT_3167729 [Favolaschia claudopus]|uniref:Uncharacterized protein n=1 Tax=Favolaschia claudopus TaxID=2862362 RepID=A0AAW0E803_9AGAR